MKNKKYYVLLIFLASVVASTLTSAQNKSTSTFNGQVMDHSRQALGGVTVKVQGQNRETITKADGTFVIACEPTDELIFSKKEFQTIQMKAADVRGLSIVLDSSMIDAGEEDDIQIPFGVRKKREVTYAVSTLMADDLPQLPLSSLSNILAGRLSGLYVEQTGTEPGENNVTFQIRGRSTYNDGNRPSVLVDGVLRDFDDMDLSQIESITVLKDAAALTWYGLDAANGVIMITTKRGGHYKTRINFNTQVGIQQSIRPIRPLNSYEYATLYNEALTNTGQSPIYDQTALDHYRLGTDPYRFPDNNYQKSFLETSSPLQRYVLNASGGDNSIRYFTTLSYYNQIGLFKQTKTKDFDSNQKYNRINFAVNLDYDVNKNLTIGVNANARSESRREPGDGAGAMLRDINELPPNAFPILNEDGSYGGTSMYQNNPLARLQSRGYTRDLTRVLSTTITAKQKLDFLTEGLSANLLYSYDVSGVYTSGLTADYEVYDFATTPPVKFRTEEPLNYRQSGFSANNRRNEFWGGFDYDRSFNQRHTINASLRFSRSVDNSVERFDFRNQRISARVDYGFNQRYFLGLVGSYAGSENFAPANRYGFFPAVSAGWIVFDENLQKSASAINFLKLRTSYGLMGNSFIGGSRLPFRTLYDRATGYPFGTTFKNSTGAVESALGNPNVTWEELKRFNAGADLQLLNRSLVVSIDYFDDRRSNILTNASIPGLLGVDIEAVNEGVVTSKGGEINFTYEKQIGAMLLSVNGNNTYAKNRVISINEDPGILKTQSQIGLNTGYVDGTKRFYISEGLFQSEEEINNSPTQLLAGTVYPGDIKYKDISGPDGVPDNVISSFDAINTNYTGIPDMIYGLGFSVTYKCFDISAQWQGTHGRTIQIKTLVNSGPNDFNQFSLDRWTPETASTAKWPRLAISDRGNNDANSDFWLRSGDYVKLKTVEIGFCMPPNVINKLNLRKARFYVGGFNLLTFSKLDIDVDPEFADAGFGSFYPSLKTYTLGLNVQF
jgi:TonB-dependent starch-binding outer membrane protein SusC